MMHISIFLFFKQKTAYELGISHWSSDVCSTDLRRRVRLRPDQRQAVRDGGQLAPRRDPFRAEAAVEHGPDRRDQRRSAGQEHRSADRRVGKEYVSTSSSPWSPYH